LEIRRGLTRCRRASWAGFTARTTADRASPHGRRAVGLAEERGSAFSRVEAAAFLGAAEFAAGDLIAATSVLERALALARKRHTALWYEPRVLATLADARLAAGDRSGARALLAEAGELIDQKRGWRLAAFDVARWRGSVSWPRSLPPTAPRSRARSSPWTPSRPCWTPILTGASRRSNAQASPSDGCNRS
jgi:hypothetical protein